MSSVDIYFYYRENEEFKEYVNKYAKTQRTLPEVCLKHVLVKEYLDMLIKEGRA